MVNLYLESEVWILQDWRLTFTRIVPQILGADAPTQVPVLAVAVEVRGQGARGDVLDHAVWVLAVVSVEFRNGQKVDPRLHDPASRLFTQPTFFL